MKRTNQNFIYNIVYQVFIFIIPLITTPYISRVLGVNNVGIYSYTYSIVYYFMMCGLLGINNYGARTIAKYSTNKEERSQAFWSIYILQLFLCFIMLFFYFLFIHITNYNHKDIMSIQSIFLISVALDINWLFFGLEKFKITISRNIIIKFLSLLFIFIIVKKNTDLWKYALIMSISTLLSQAYLWLYIKKNVCLVKVSFKRILLHLKPCLVLFVPVIAYSIYRVMDKTMIGFFSNMVELGNYESAEKIINIPLSFVTALGTVMLPHMVKIDDSEINKKVKSTFELCFCFILPMIFGLFAISNDFTAIFFGSSFTKTSTIIKFLLPTILFASIANVIRTSYLIPKAKDYIYIKSTLYGAGFNFVFNFMLIKHFGAYGACMGTIVAEFTVMVYQILKTSKIIHYVPIVKLLVRYIIKSTVMFFIIIFVGMLFNNDFLKLITQLIVGVIVCFILNYKYLIYDFFGKK